MAQTMEEYQKWLLHTFPVDGQITLKDIKKEYKILAFLVRYMDDEYDENCLALQLYDYEDETEGIYEFYTNTNEKLDIKCIKDIAKYTFRGCLVCY